MLVENLLGDKLLLLKKQIVSEGLKYFNKIVVVKFVFIDMQNISAMGLSRFIAYNLERGNSFLKILRLIMKEFKDISKDNIGIGHKLSHRYRGVYMEGVPSFSKILISSRYLLGYRIDIAGRYSRKQ